MKGILVIIDGLGDLPCRKLGGKTPLEAADKQNLNYLASHGEIGTMYPVGKDIVPESDSAVLSILGNEKLIGYRGVFEAIGAGLELKHGDLSLRVNFATIDNLENKELIDRRAGRTLTTKEAFILANMLNKEIKLPCKFIFRNTVQHRGVLVLNGGFSDNITNTDPAYHTKGSAKQKDKLNFSQPLDEEENSKYTSNILNEFIEQSFKTLQYASINNERRKKGLLPANIVLTRDASIEVPRIKKFKKWASIVYMPLEIGISKTSGMEVFSFPYPDLKDYNVYENLYTSLKQACKFSIKTLKKQQKNFDYFYIHFKEPDVPGHDNFPLEKKSMIEFLDKNFFSFLKKFAGEKKIKIIITADHSTPCELKEHSAGSVPVLICDWRKREEREFSEKKAEEGELGRIQGKELLKIAGFVK